MKPYIVKHRDFLKFFRNLTPKSKLQIIPNLNKDQVNSISEICKNFLKRNITQDPKVIKKLKSSRKEIKTLALKTTPLYKKKKILQTRQGGAILSVLLPLAASFITSLFMKK